ncbi:MAG: dipicolinate synthase subunit B [Clostridia bacterium]|nr:dipicolinate synthase subunit B [Clostridia bacterium]
MEYVFRYNQSSTDMRVAELKKLFTQQGYQALDFNDQSSVQKGIYYLEPRVTVDEKFWRTVIQGSLVFGYQPTIDNVPAGVTYVSLNEDAEFIKANNQLTAKAFRQIVDKSYQGKNKKILICGYGKLTTALEEVFHDWKIAILNFNWHKMPELKKKYGNLAYFKDAPFQNFSIIVNTIPCSLIQVSNWEQGRNKQKIYDLASAPFGFDWRGVNQADYDYKVLPGLPGKFYPREAGTAVFDCIQRYLTAHAKPALALCITGSACSFAKMLDVLAKLVEHYEIFPVVSPNANVPNRFMDNLTLQSEIRRLTGHEIVTTIAGAERLSSMTQLKGSIVFPATGNTLAKLTHGITDTCVLMAVKALLRNNKPCVIGLATNDALSSNAKNIGELLNRRNYYFVPFRQDQPIAKPYSCICDFEQILPTVAKALTGQQIQPLLLGVI